MRGSKVTVRFLIASCLAACRFAGAPGDDGVTPPPTDAGAEPVPAPIAFSTVRIAEADTLQIPGDGDLWPSCWSDDGHLYAAWGDGRGFGSTFADVGVARITGSPFDGTLAGQNLALGDAIGRVWTAGPYNRKPTGMVCVEGDLYVAVQDLNLDFDDAPAATIARSTDKGVTWQWDPAGPMFTGEMTTLFFADFGKAGEHRFDDHVYVYGLDHNWRDSFSGAVEDPTRLYLARVPRDAIQDRSRWEYFAGSDDAGTPSWTADLAGRVPVLEDTRRLYTNTVANFRAGSPRDLSVLSQGSVVYNAPLERYLYTSWTEYTFEFYEAPAPWGPWKRFLSKDYGSYPWFDDKNGGYATTIPSKFISPDGKHMFVQSNTFMGGIANYTFSLRDLHLEPFTATQATNVRGEPIPTASAGAVPLARSLHFGRAHVLGDGPRVEPDDSWSGEAKAVDLWGYTWPRVYTFDRVTYTTGPMYPDGGWFETLTIEVRQHGTWVEVGGLTSSPAYPLGAPAGDHQDYVFRFAAIAGDGIRIIGAPGGSARFTSIAELSVGFEE